MKRTPMKRSQPKRDWTAAREKVEEEGRCRLYGFDLGCAGPLEAAHIIGREHDRYVAAWAIEMETLDVSSRPAIQGSVWRVAPDRIVPLCKFHHDRYDGRDKHSIDLLPALTLEEQAQAVLDAGGIENARVRTAPSQYGRGTT